MRSTSSAAIRTTRQEHRLPDGPNGSLGALPGVRPRLLLQSERCLDRTAPDVAGGKRDDFTSRTSAVGRVAMLKRGQARRILDEVTAVVSEWPRHAESVGVDAEHIRRITPTLRLALASN